MRAAAATCHGVFTHFKREEDDELQSGKLDDELVRMSAIADHIRPGALLLCNESFASTNEREGSEIARQIIGAGGRKSQHRTTGRPADARSADQRRPVSATAHEWFGQSTSPELTSATATSRWPDVAPAAVVSDDRSLRCPVSTSASAVAGSRSPSGPSRPKLAATSRALTRRRSWARPDPP